VRDGKVKEKLKVKVGGKFETKFENKFLTGETPGEGLASAPGKETASPRLLISITSF
jgi:hypothetical protein